MSEALDLDLIEVEMEDAAGPFDYGDIACKYIPALVAEVERLRTENAVLRIVADVVREAHEAILYAGRSAWSDPSNSPDVRDEINDRLCAILRAVQALDDPATRDGV